MVLSTLPNGKKVMPEKAYSEVFREEDYGVFYKDEMANRKWNNVWYEERETWNDTIVVIFYNDLMRGADDNWYLQHLNQSFPFSPKVISKALNIPCYRNPHLQYPSLELTAILPLITCEGKMRGSTHCIDFLHLRKNQALVAYWIGSNVIGTSKPTDVHRLAAHILHQLQNQNRRFCLATTLFDMITQAKEKGPQTAILPVLISKIWKNVWKIPTPQGSNEVEIETQEVNRTLSHNVLPSLWTPEAMRHWEREHARMEDFPPGQYPLAECRLDGINDPNTLARLQFRGMEYLHNQMYYNHQEAMGELNKLNQLVDGMWETMHPQARQNRENRQAQRRNGEGTSRGPNNDNPDA